MGLFMIFSGETPYPGLLASPGFPLGHPGRETLGRDRLQRIGGDAGLGYPAPAAAFRSVGPLPRVENVHVYDTME